MVDRFAAFELIEMLTRALTRALTRRASSDLEPGDLAQRLARKAQRFEALAAASLGNPFLGARHAQHCRAVAADARRRLRQLKGSHG